GWHHHVRPGPVHRPVHDHRGAGAGLGVLADRVAGAPLRPGPTPHPFDPLNYNGIGARMIGAMDMTHPYHPLAEQTLRARRLTFAGSTRLRALGGVAIGVPADRLYGSHILPKE